MMKEKLVFVTNDDGYNSRGIQALLEVARKFGRVVAIAPETAAERYESGDNDQ